MVVMDVKLLISLVYLMRPVIEVVSVIILKEYVYVDKDAKV